MIIKERKDIEPDEVWVDIKGFEGCYQVSNRGHVKSLRRIVPRSGLRGFQTINERILSDRKNSCGYLSVTLHNEEVKRMVTVHRLVAETFIHNPNNKRCIDHINGIKADNRVENLRWCTHYENSNYPIAKLNYALRPPSFAGKRHSDDTRAYFSRIRKNNKWSSREVWQTDLNGNEIKLFPSISEAGRVLEIKHSNVVAICKGRQNSARGFKFKYNNF